MSRFIPIRGHWLWPRFLLYVLYGLPFIALSSNKVGIGVVCGQEANLIHYTPKDGLCGGTIYKMEQDFSGYLWILTGSGLCRYDGNEFQEMDSRQGINSQDLYYAYLDGQGRYWCWGFAPLLYYWAGNGFRYIDFSKYSRSNSLQISITGVFRDKNGYIWAGLVDNKKHRTLVLSGDGHLKNTIEDINLYYTHVEKSGKIVGIARDSIDSYHVVYLDIKNYTFLQDHKILTKLPYGDRGFVYENDTIFGIGTYQSWYIALNDIAAGQQDLGYKLSFYTEKNKQWWVSYWSKNSDRSSKRDGGVCEIDRFGLDVVQKKCYLPHITTNSIFIDKENTTWIGTEGMGLYRLPASKIKKYELHEASDNVFTTIAEIPQSGKIWAANNQSMLFEIDPNRQRIDRIELPQAAKKAIANGIKNIIPLRNGDVALQWHMDRLEVFDEKKRRVSSSTKLLGRTALKRADSDNLIVATRNGLILELLPPHYTQADTLLSLNQRVFSMALKNNTLWIGSELGLKSYDLNTCVQNDYSKQHHSLILTMRDMLWVGDTLWITTNGGGVVACDPNGRVVAQYNTQNSLLAADMCNALYYSPNLKCMWVATNKGVSRIYLNNKQQPPKPHTIQTISYLDGLIAPEVTDIIVDSQQQVWLTTKGGIVYFYYEDIVNDTIKPHINRLHLQTLGPNKPSNPTQKQYNLGYNQNYLIFEWEAVSLRSKLLYYYKLSGWDKDWQTTDESVVRYSNLLPGDYTFTVYAQKQSNEQHSSELQINVHIGKPFWKRFDFIGSAILLLLFILVTLVKYRIKMAKKQGQLAELGLMGLNNQMNAHFLFNALNAIQGLVLTKSEQKAADYISTFAQLMRQTLHHSRSGMVPIRSEIKMLENYLEIENLRLNGAFDYIFYIADTIVPEQTFIPPMFIQPYVENAIRWGFHKIPHRGQLRISFEKQHDNVICTITDNGVGIAQTQKLRHNMAILMTAEGLRQEQTNLAASGEINKDRMRIIRNIYNKKCQVSTNDILDENGNSCGTKVILTLPILDPKKT